MDEAEAKRIVNAHRGRHKPGTPGLIRCHVRYWPTDPDAKQQAEDIVRLHGELIQHVGEDVAEAVTVQQAATGSASAQAFAGWYYAAAVKADPGTKEGMSFVQLATQQQRLALESTRSMLAFADHERERRAKDIPADGRELFGGSGKAGR